MAIYIRATGNISIQDTLSKSVLTEAISYSTPYTRCIDPDFKTYLPPLLLRRMSHIIKRAIVAAIVCLKEGGVEQPDAIISGTGLGCIEDTEKFLHAMINNEEKLLQPSHFIQSTHNTISSQIAIFLKCHGYNNTYTHRGISFETALMDAYTLFKTQQIHTALVGGHDEMTPTYFIQLKKLGFWKDSIENSLTICKADNSPTIGSLSGEGNICFLLTDTVNDQNYATITDLQLLYNINAEQDLALKTVCFLEKNQLTTNDIDLLLCGNNGDYYTDKIYNHLQQTLFSQNAYASYKNLSGEFFTASAFGLWSAATIIKNQNLPDIQRLNDIRPDKIKHILLFNHYKNKNYSLILVSLCGC